MESKAVPKMNHLFSDFFF